MIQYSKVKPFESKLNLSNKIQAKTFLKLKFSLVHSMSDFKKNYLEFEPWVDWYFSFVVEPRDYVRISKRKPVHYDDDIAVEVLNFRKSLTNFAGKTSALSINNRSNL